MKKISILIYITFLITVISSCSKKAGPIQGEVIFITGTVKINNSDAAVGSMVSNGDTLITGEKSEAVIQISDAATITLRSGTEMKFGNLLSNTDESKIVAMELNKGNTYHKIIRKGTDYSVKAPTAVASVRGTSFEMSAEEKNTRINVDTGRVYVRILSGFTKRGSQLTDEQIKGTDEIVLTAGQSLEIFSNGSSSRDEKERGSSDVITAGKKKSLSMNPPVKKSREKLEPENKTLSEKKSRVNAEVSIAKRTDRSKKDTAYISGKKEAAADSIVPENKSEKKPDPEEVKSLVKKKDRNLEDIKEVYSRIDKVYLYSGDVITGAIIDRGETYSIFTTAGIVKVSRKDIQSNEIIK